jgi:hypothetical protein
MCVRARAHTHARAYTHVVMSAPAAPVRVGAIRVGQKHGRGVPGQRNVAADGFVNIDVTSGSAYKINGRVLSSTLSPMRIGPVLDIDTGAVLARVFENYWQYSKLWSTAGHGTAGEQTESEARKWEAFRDAGFDLVKGKRRPFAKALGYGVPDGCIYGGRAMGYVESRKLAYVPHYAGLIESSAALDELEALVRGGTSVMLIDGDGPPRDAHPHGMELTAANWRQMINDASCPFGHAWVVARELAKRCHPHIVCLDD